MDVLVTVGMSRWPFDRLMGGVDGLAAEHRVFAQIGHANLRPSCPHERFIPFEELRARIASADVVVTHAGNTVRLAQRAGKVPIAIARRAALGEMGNDHQVEYLRHEERAGRVVAVWDVERLPLAVRRHRQAEAALLAERPAPRLADGERVADVLEHLLVRRTRSPFERHPLRRYDYAWRRLARRSGRHLDVGCGTGEFLSGLDASTALACYGVDAHRGYLGDLRNRSPHLDARWVATSGPLPFATGFFSSVSALDVLEHVPDEDALLGEIRRVLAPGGAFVLTVPRQHILSFLDPDNAKFRFPRLHRAVYSQRFGGDVYRRRFVDLSDGLRGDIAVERTRHENYVRAQLERRLRDHGFRIEHVAGANLFWRLLQTPALLARGALKRLLESAIAIDGRLFSSANLFITAMRDDS
jgi:ubiquinone/menaquinone biosynthesis C-methylase UbiE/UDP-N-acetylglucosamine transferase subunit ALG13